MFFCHDHSVLIVNHFISNGQVGTSSYVYREPNQKPIDPPYKQACDLKKQGSK